MKNQSIIGFLYLVLSNLSYSQINHTFDGQIALNHIERQVSLGPRSITVPETKALTHQYIVNTLSKYTTRLISQPFESNKLEGHNIWATFPEKINQVQILDSCWARTGTQDLNRSLTIIQRTEKYPLPGQMMVDQVSLAFEIARILS